MNMTEREGAEERMGSSEMTGVTVSPQTRQITFPRVILLGTHAPDSSAVLRMPKPEGGGSGSNTSEHSRPTGGGEAGKMCFESAGMLNLLASVTAMSEYMLLWNIKVFYRHCINIITLYCPSIAKHLLEDGPGI